MQNIPQHQQAEFMRSLQTTQMRDSLKMYNHLVLQLSCGVFQSTFTNFRMFSFDELLRETSRQMHIYIYVCVRTQVEHCFVDCANSVLEK